MSLVQYSDTESEGGSGREGEIRSTSRSPKRRCRRSDNAPRKSDGRGASALPPLPAEFRDLYSTSARVSVQDDPSLHNGRTRAVPHVAGNWPTHIYLEWYPDNTELGILSKIIKGCQNAHGKDVAIHSLLYSDLGAQLPLHISLSRPVALLTEQREPFLDLFRDYLHKSRIKPFEISPHSLAWESNFESTRWFLVLRLNRPANNGLNQLLRLSNSVLSHFSQPPLYENPVGTQKRKNRKQAGNRDDSVQSSASIDTDHTDCFHISIAWTLEEPSDEEKERLTTIDLRVRELVVEFNSVKVKVGNQIHNERLFASVTDETGLEGV
ncbi:hypothetical protein MGYG_05126 [Nannizzia gypsea CBS 118893]|uniref:U6 snRNA phosphodiesterase n=1 Tax=Arthroderma gypseum (strain ATCC MYA-4604 / CBS 118893) TaxID=535722 RepID=E4UYG1_ARTGP|nr:hypothetical protein MGYG_05126 [Nannizzia gypsea CBS 118893]EFR02124.1 hypothetical protein MGYG_05126 [Nannizzia gypsea CBS 118893]